MNKKRVFIVTAVLSIITMSGVAFAATRPTEVGAGEKPPIVKTVENHEERISDAETRLDDVQTQTNQNTSDIQSLGNQVSSVSQRAQSVETKVVERVQTVVEKPAPLKEEDYPVTPSNPVVDPWTITSVNGVITDVSPGRVSMNCTYSFANGNVGIVRGQHNIDENGNVKYTTSPPKCQLTVGTVPSQLWLKHVQF